VSKHCFDYDLNPHIPSLTSKWYECEETMI